MGYIGTFSFSFLLKYLIVIISPQVMRCANKELTIRKLLTFVILVRFIRQIGTFSKPQTIETVRLMQLKHQIMRLFSKQNKKQDSRIDFDLLLAILINNISSQSLSTRIFDSEFDKYS